MNKREELYVHFAECMDNLHRAWNLVKEIQKADPKSNLTLAAYELALIEYSKAFKPSEGIHSKRYRWPEPDLGKDELALHREIIRLRDKVLAHSDLTLKDAKVYASKSGSIPIMTIITNIRESLPPADKVFALTEQILRMKYKELAALDRELAESAA